MQNITPGDERTDSCWRRVRAMRVALSVPSSSWYMLALANMSTMLREWVALHLAYTLTCQQALLGLKVSPLPWPRSLCWPLIALSTEDEPKPPPPLPLD